MFVLKKGLRVFPSMIDGFSREALLGSQEGWLCGGEGLEAMLSGDS